MADREFLTKAAKTLRDNMTMYEKKLWFQFLREYYPAFRNQKVIGNYIVDFYCRRARLSIELDGSQHYEKKARDYDRCRTLFLEMHEIKELRFTNTQIMEEFEGVCEVIHQEVLKRLYCCEDHAFQLLKNKH